MLLATQKTLKDNKALFFNQVMAAKIENSFSKISVP